MGAALIAQGRLGEAGPVLDEAASLFESAGHLPLLCSVLLEQSALQRACGDREAALQSARRALELVSGEKWPVQRIYANLRMADLLFPDPQAAEEYLLEARRLAQAVNLPVINYRLNSRLGHLCMLQKRHAQAQSYLQAAIAEIEGLRGNLAHEAGRASFLQDMKTC
jgi:tetratricopeptide (TPR) repeat protein